MCTVYDFLLQLHNCYRYVSRWRLEMVGFARAHTHTQYQHNNFQRQYHSVLGIILFCFSFHSKIHTMNYLLLIFIQFSSSAFIRLQCVLYIWCVAVLPLLRLIVTLCNVYAHQMLGKFQKIICTIHCLYVHCEPMEITDETLTMWTMTIVLGICKSSGATINVWPID